MAKYPKVSEVKDRIWNYQIKARSLMKRRFRSFVDASTMNEQPPNARRESAAPTEVEVDTFGEKIISEISNINLGTIDEIKLCSYYWSRVCPLS